MNSSRRSFLMSGSKLGLAALVTGGLSSIAFGQKSGTPLGSGVGAPVPKTTLTDPLYNITRSMFTGSLRTKFGVSLAGVSITQLTLIEVNDQNPPFAKNPGTSSRDCYQLVFTAPANRPLGQNTYTIDHAKLGKFQLFVVQGARTGADIRYGALINRVYP